MQYAAIHRNHGHVADSFATTGAARRRLETMAGTAYGREHRFAVIDDSEKEIREVSPHEIALITDRDYAILHGDKAP